MQAEGLRQENQIKKRHNWAQRDTEDSPIAVAHPCEVGALSIAATVAV